MSSCIADSCSALTAGAGVFQVQPQLHPRDAQPEELCVRAVRYPRHRARSQHLPHQGAPGFPLMHTAVPR